MASPTLCYWFGIVLLYSSYMTAKKRTLPFNMSSTPKGSLWRPALVAFIEDAGCIEANGGVQYRATLMKRYEVSPVFRHMVLCLSWAWGVLLICVAITATVLIACLDEDVGFGLGWGLPYVVSTLGVVSSMVYVKRELRKELRLWPGNSCLESA